MEQLLTVAEVAKMLSISETWVRDHASRRRQPHLSCVRLGKAMRFRKTDVEQFVEWCMKFHAERVA